MQGLHVHHVLCWFTYDFCWCQPGECYFLCFFTKSSLFKVVQNWGACDVQWIACFVSSLLCWLHWGLCMSRYLVSCNFPLEPVIFLLTAEVVFLGYGQCIDVRMRFFKVWFKMNFLMSSCFCWLQYIYVQKTSSPTNKVSTAPESFHLTSLHSSSLVWRYSSSLVQSSSSAVVIVQWTLIWSSPFRY